MVLGQFGPQISENWPRTIRDAVPQLGVKPALIFEDHGNINMLKIREDFVLKIWHNLAPIMHNFCSVYWNNKY